MTDGIVFLCGASLVLLVFYDFLRTTISLDGMGFISRAFAKVLWWIGARLVSFLEQKVGWSIRGLLGPTILTAIAGMWVVLHLAGYMLMYRSGLSLVDSQSGDPASLAQAAAFSGSTLSTLGASTVQVTGGWWDILSMIAAVNGMVLLTLSVSFLLNILQTTNAARVFAVRFRSLRDVDADDKLENISGLGPDLLDVAVKMAASPLPQFFIPADTTMDFPSAVLELCDLLQSSDAHADTVPELRSAVVLLGRHMRGSAQGDDIASARLWAKKYTILQRPGQ